jgi:hypothetical protein
MPTSIELKACGGIGPYTWSSTGDVTLSATEGIQITVYAGTPGQTDGSNGAYSNTPAYAQIGLACGEFPATGPSCPTTVLADCCAQSTVYNCAGEELDAQNWSCNAETGAFPTYSISGTDCGGGPESESDNTGASCVDIIIESGTGTFSYTCTGFGSVSGSVPVEAAGSELKHPVSAYADLRTQEMIDGGCGFPGTCNDPAGATITLTDWAGVSTTYVIA